MYTRRSIINASGLGLFPFFSNLFLYDENSLYMVMVGYSCGVYVHTSHSQFIHLPRIQNVCQKPVYNIYVNNLQVLSKIKGDL